MLVEALVDLLELLLVLHLLTKGARLIAVSLLGCTLATAANLGLAGLFRRGVVGVGVFFLQVLQNFDEDCFDLRVLVEKGVAIT